MLKIIQKRKFFLTLSGILVLLSVIGFLFTGLNYGIDFTGGSLMELEFKAERPSNVVISDALAGFELGAMNVQPTGEKGVILRFKDVDEGTHRAIFEKLNLLGDGEATSTASSVSEAVEEIRFESVGPAIGKELKQKTFWAIFVALIAIVFYVAWAFRKVSRTISSWKYGVCAIFALFHDIMIVIGVFVLLGKFGVEVNAPFVAALLTILGYSVNDTIVIFDRVRENLPKLSEGFEDIVNTSINESLSSSINTSITTFVALFAIYLFGGATIHNFILALLIGVAAGTYSSIFVASPILVEWQKWKK